MSTTSSARVALGSPTRQSNPVDDAVPELSTHVANALALMRKCVSDCGWTLEALEAAMDVDKSQISRVLNGERRMTLEFFIALPDDIERLYERRRCEAAGLIVVECVSDDVARQQFACGLFNLLAPRLPAKASAMARADLPATKKVATR